MRISFQHGGGVVNEKQAEVAGVQVGCEGGEEGWWDAQGKEVALAIVVDVSVDIW
jgi:hypothetical protein